MELRDERAVASPLWLCVDASWWRLFYLNCRIKRVSRIEQSSPLSGNINLVDHTSWSFVFGLMMNSWTATSAITCLDMHDMRPTPLVLVETVIINISGGGDAQRRGTININANCDCEVWWHNKLYTKMDVQRLSSFFFPSLCVSIAHHREIILF